MQKTRFLICRRIGLMLAAALLGCSAEHHPAEDSAVNTQGEITLESPQPEQTSNSIVRDLADESVVMHQTLSIYLLGRSAVQEQLGLTDDQRQEVRQIKLNGIKQYWGLRNSVSSKTDGTARRTAVRAALVIAHDVEKKLQGFLSDVQRQRLDQKVWHINVGPVTFARTGPLVLLHPHVDEALELSDDQRHAIAEIAQQTLQSVDDSVSFVFSVDAADEILQEGRSRAEMELTEFQRKKWNTMRGDARTVKE